MLLNQGDKVLVVHRRLFEKDDPRFFAGTVEEYEEGIAKVVGYTFVRDVLGGQVERKSEPRTKLLAISSGTLLVYQLLPETSIEALTMTASEGELQLSDGVDFLMNLSEWTHH